METEKLFSTQYAAHLAGVSVTYFRQLANQPELIEPQRLTGSVVLCWTPTQVREIAARVKRQTTTAK